MTLAIFDLDNTLIAGDSDHAWGQFLADKGIVNAEEYEKANDQFYQDYLSGKLDMTRYLEFSLAPLAAHPMTSLLQWREQFVNERIKPLMLNKAEALVRSHREQGHYILIITATNRFVTEPIAELLGVDHLIATDPEIIDNRYTGAISGIPSFKEGKVTRLNNWLKEQQYSLEGSYFYSDSHNDLPLLEIVDTPVAVDADEKLTSHAMQNNWKIISLR
ncbi:histidinol-phosphatase [Alkalimarinus alittae]|uniref:HAD-IB family hydrolase n=1 Tax=Alkalimarinus alittae TaxID=2961619 RepID=A0ABY6N0W4_9ALTE|nr:HAD family hydrolase [Alkalimarinus alittae]UZE95743.1 HAD-IB family hydrolase [Alkalimarinus alittae]